MPCGLPQQGERRFAFLCHNILSFGCVAKNGVSDGGDGRPNTRLQGFIDAAAARTPSRLGPRARIRPGACRLLQIETASYDVQEVPLAQISADLAGSKATSVALTKAYIARIKANDAPLHAVIAIAPDALDQATAADKRRKDGQLLGPLDGVPILIKDNIDAVGMPTTAGSYALADNKPAQDSEVARRLRAAGVVILAQEPTCRSGRASAPAVAFNSSTDRRRRRHNPYNLDHSTCGSSSGSGVAAADEFRQPPPIGTETDGSVVCPSSTNGLVGIKPTIALVSRRGIVPISHTQDSSGPMARSVTDAAMLLTVMAGSDPADPQSAESDAHKTDYVKGLDAGALKGARLGVLRGTQGSSDKTDPVYEAALAVLKAQGAELVEIPPRSAGRPLSQEQLTVLLLRLQARTSPPISPTIAAADKGRRPARSPT